MTFDEVINKMSQHYIPRGFRYKIGREVTYEHGAVNFHSYYDGAMTIKFYTDDSNLIFIIGMDGVYVNEETSNSHIKFYLNLKSLPILPSDKIDLPQMVEHRIGEIGTPAMKSHYKGSIRNFTLKQIGIE